MTFILKYCWICRIKYQLFLKKKKKKKKKNVEFVASNFIIISGISTKTVVCLHFTYKFKYVELFDAHSSWTAWLGHANRKRSIQNISYASCTPSCVERMVVGFGVVEGTVVCCGLQRPEYERCKLWSLHFATDRAHL